MALGFERSAQVLNARRLLREQLIAAISYPTFVLISALAAVGLILFGVIPSLQPLVEDAGENAAPALSFLLSISIFLRVNAVALSAFSILLLVLLGLVVRMGVLTRPIQRLLLDGPTGRSVSGLVFGGFAQSLGAMLSAGAPIGEALRLAIRTANWREARERLGPVLAGVRQGEPLSLSLDQVRSFPPAIVRLSAVGEETGTLGPMLARSGALEEQAALRKIDQAAKLLGPFLIIFLGGLVGGLMAAMLSGVTSLGETALQ